MYHDIATVKESENDKSLGQIVLWHIMVSVNFKRIRFFVAKGDMPKDMSAIMQQEKPHGHSISIIRQDNAGKTKKLVTLAHSQDWKLAIVFQKYFS